MRQLCLAIFIFVSPVVGWAQTVVVRAGEHRDFTRVTLTIPLGIEWKLTPAQTSAKLQLQMSGATFDTGGVFRRIGRDRLADLVADEPAGELEFRFGCDCETKAFVENGTLLVVDIRDSKTGRSEPTAPRALPTTADVRLRFPGQAAPPVGDARPDFDVPVEFVGRRRRADVPRPQHADDAKNTQQPLPVTLSEERLLEQLGRGISQGLLTPAGLESGPVEDDPPKQDPRPEPRDHAPESDVFSAVTVIDRDLAAIAAELPNPGQIECYADAAVALHDWAGEESFPAQIATARNALYRDLDKTDQDGVFELARLYLHFGFGAEARRSLELTVDDRPQKRLLVSLSYLIDGDPEPGRGAFADQSECGGDSVLWSVLTDPDVLHHADKDAVQRAFARLPAHLRRHIGPRLSEHFTDVGDAAGAEAILRAVHRATEDEGDGALHLAEGRISALEGDTEAAVKKLETVVDGNSEKSPVGLVELVDATFESRRGIAPDIPDLAASYAIEFRRTDLGPPLRRASVVAFALAGRFDEAFDQLDETRQIDGSAALADAKEPLFQILTEQADDITFLKHAIPQVREIDLSEKTALTLAERLVALGFSGQALDLLDTPSDRRVSAAHRLLRAKAAADTGDNHQALVDLLGLDGTEANRLRASILERNGDFATAGLVYSRVEDAESALRGYWHAGDTPPDMPTDVPSEVPVYGTVVELADRLVRPAPTRPDEPPLAAARALIESSATARDDIAQLLDTLSIGNPAE